MMRKGLGAKVLLVDFFLSVLLWSVTGSIFPQSESIDSLKHLADQAENPEVQARALLDLAATEKNKGTGLSFSYLGKAVEVARSLENPQLEADALMQTAKIHFQISDYPTAINFYQQALNAYVAAHDSVGIANCYNGMGIIFKNQGNLEKSLDYQLEHLKISEQLGDELLQSKAYNNLGVIYRRKKEYETALQYLKKSLVLKRKLEVAPRLLLRSINNIGEVYALKEEYEEAEFMHRDALLIALSLKDPKQDLNLCKSSLARVLAKTGRVEESRLLLIETMTFYQETSLYFRLAEDYLTLADMDQMDNNPVDSYRNAQFAFAYAKRVNALQVMLEAVRMMTENARAVNDFQAALEAQTEWIALQDTIAQVQKSEVMQQMEFRYTLEKQASRNELLKAENDTQSEIIQRQRVVNGAIGLGLLGFVITALVFYRQKIKGRKVNRELWTKNKEVAKQNHELRLQNDEIVRQKNLLAEQKNELEANKEEMASQRDLLSDQHQQLEMINKDFTDSINYAQRMQSAMLPQLSKIKESFSETFIFYQPREAVSGDFYWFSKTAPLPIYETHQDNPFFEAQRIFKGFESEKWVIAAADCTGHGVPGAFMSMKGDALLNQIVNVEGIRHTDEILNELHQEVRSAFNQGQTHNQDGMDIALCLYDPETKTLEFSGAKNPLYYVQNGELKIIKGNNFPIGGEQVKGERLFSRHELPIHVPTTFYIFTDGFQDQFGGEKGKKFMVGKFRRLLLEISELPMKEQQTQLKNTFEQWKAGYEQLDDVLIIGIRLIP